MVCISHLDQFTVPHLSNKYAGKGILPAEDFHAQVKALLKISRNGKFKETLFPVETTLFHGHVFEGLLRAVPRPAYSAGSRRKPQNTLGGVRLGVYRTAADRDGEACQGVANRPVIAVNAAAKGVEIVYGDLRTAVEKLSKERFDCVLLSNVLHLVKDPAKFLSPLVDLLASEGVLIASVPNLSVFRRLSRRIRLQGHAANPMRYDLSGMHPSNGRLLRRWCQEAGLKIKKVVFEVSEGVRKAEQTISWAR